MFQTCMQMILNGVVLASAFTAQTHSDADSSDNLPVVPITDLIGLHHYHFNRTLISLPVTLKIIYQAIKFLTK